MTRTDASPQTSPVVNRLEPALRTATVVVAQPPPVSPRAPVIALALVVLLGGGLRAARAPEPSRSRG